MGVFLPLIQQYVVSATDFVLERQLLNEYLIIKITLLINHVFKVFQQVLRYIHSFIPNIHLALYRNKLNFAISFDKLVYFLFYQFKNA